jgi:hypothetical protein
MMRISLHHARPFRVSLDQVLALCDEISHLGRLCERMRAAVETGATLHLTDSEALLLVAEIRRRSLNDDRPLETLANSLLDHIEPARAQGEPIAAVSPAAT